VAVADDAARQQLDEREAEVAAARASFAAHPFVGPKRTLARTLVRYGVALRARDRNLEARDAYVEAQTLLTDAVELLGDRKDEELLAGISMLLALVHDRLDDIDAAGEALRSAADRRRALAARSPDNARSVARLVDALTALARHERLNGDHTVPAPGVVEAVMIGREALRDRAVSVEVRHALAGALGELADATAAGGDLEATSEVRLEAVRVLQPAADHLAATPRDRIACATALHDLAKVALHAGDLIAAREASEEATERLDWLDLGDRDDDPDNTDLGVGVGGGGGDLAVLRPLGLALVVTGQVATEQGRFDDADAAFARAAAVAERVRPYDEPLALALDTMVSGDRLRLAGRRRDVVGVLRGLWSATERLQRFQREFQHRGGATYRNELNRSLFGRADPTNWSAMVHSGRLMGRGLAGVAVGALRRLPFPVPGVPRVPARPAGVPDDASGLED